METDWCPSLLPGGRCNRALADHIRRVHVAALCPCSLQRPHLYFFGGRAAFPPISPPDRMRFVLGLPAPAEACGTAGKIGMPSGLMERDGMSTSLTQVASVASTNAYTREFHSAQKGEADWMSRSSKTGRLQNSTRKKKRDVRAQK